MNRLSKEDKLLIMEDIESKVDAGMRELINAINAVNDLVTMNSCQGTLITEESHKHCPKTYVDFYVLNHNYNLANNIFVELVSEMGDMVNCIARFEADSIRIIEDDEVYFETNGYINMRYSLEFIDIHGYLNMTADEIYRKAIEIISRYSK